VRAVVPRFRELDRSVSRQEFPCLDRAGAGGTAIGTGLRFFGGARLLRGNLLTQLASDRLTDFVGTLLNGGEVRASGATVTPEHSSRDQCEKLLDLGVLKTIGRRGAKHHGPP
jgi:hypothetical protein